MSKSILPMFSSKNCIVSSFTDRSLIHFIFVYGVREYSNFILLHLAVQFSQHHLLKRLSFLHCIFLPPSLWIILLTVCELISGCSIVFHWLIFLSLCWCHTVWLLWLYSTVWSQGSLFLPLCFSFSRLLWVFEVCFLID